jgi:hypothetical protein
MAIVDGRQIEPGQCLRGFIQPEQHRLVPRQPVGMNLVGPAAVLCRAPTVDLSVAIRATGYSPAHSLSPPDDLICLLKHLLI